MKKRILSGLLAAAMVGSLMAGCGDEKKGGTAVAGPVPDYDNGELYANAKICEEPIYPSYMLRTNENFTKDTEAYQWIGDITGIYFQPIPVPLNAYAEKLSARIASGDIPDYQAMRSASTPKQYGPKGMFVNMSERMEKGEMPNLKKRLEDASADAFVVLKAPDGQIYGAPRIYTYTMLHESFMMRTDLSKKWGFGDHIKTFDELHEFLKKCKAEYPDSTPLGSRWGAMHAPNGFAEMFDGMIELAYLDPIDGQTWKMGPMEPGFKDMLEYLHMLYEEGIFDPEFASTSDEQWKEGILTDRIMLTYDYMSGCDELEESGKSRNPSFEFRPVIPPSAGRLKLGIADTSHPIYQCCKVISAKSDYIEPLVRFTDWTYSKEGADVINYGKEGETFKYDEKGKVVLMDDVKTIHNMEGTKDLSKMGVAAEWTSLETEEMEVLKSIGPNTRAAQQKFRELGAVLACQPSLTFTDEEMLRKNQLYGPLNTFKEEKIVRFITGQDDLADYDKFVEEIKSMGIEEYMQLYKTAYDRQMAL